MEVDEIRPGYKWTEVGVIPEDWSTSTIAAEFDIELGKRIDAPNNFGDLKPVITNIGVQWGFVDLKTITPVPLTPSDLARYRLRFGDLLLCEGGEVGRSAIWEHDDVECYHQNTLHRLRRIRSASPRFLRYLLELWSSSGVLGRFATQTSIAHLTKEALSAMPLPGPQLPREQQLISEALASCEQLILQGHLLLAKKRDLKQAAMQELLSGRHRLPGFEKPFVSASYGDLFDFLPTSANSRAQLKPDGEVLYVHYGDVHTSYESHLDFSRTASVRIDRELCSRAASLRNGDWIMADASEDLEAVGKSVEVVGLRGGQQAVSGLHTFLLREKRSTFAPGFKGFMGKLTSLHSALMKVTTGTKVYGVPREALKQVQLRYPQTIEEQGAIVSILTGMDAEIAALDARFAKYREIKQGMMQNLLTGAIRLV